MTIEVKKISSIIMVCLLVAGSFLSIMILQTPPFTSPWEIEVVDDSPRVGEGSSIAIDSQDNPHISYYDGQFTHQKYAFWDGEKWNFETVDDELWTGEESIMQIDNNDGVHIISRHSSSGTNYYRLVEGNWTFFTNLRTGVPVKSMELNNNAYPQIICSDLNFVNVFAFNGIDIVEVLALAEIDYSSPYLPYWASGASLTVDNEDCLHISFHKITGYDPSERYSELVYGTYIDSQWNFEFFENKTLDVETYWTSIKTYIALDSTSSPHICYYDGTDDAIKHSYKVESEWVTEIAANGSAYDISMAIDSKDNICLSYFNSSEKDLRYSQSTEDGWYTITIDKGGVVGKQSSIAIDSEDGVHISYYDETNTYLKHAFRTNPDSTHLYLAEVLILASIVVWVIWSRKGRATRLKQQKG